MKIPNSDLVDLPEEVISELSNNYSTIKNENPSKLILEALKSEAKLFDLDDLIVSLYKKFQYKISRQVLTDTLESLVGRGEVYRSPFEKVYWYPSFDLIRY